MADIVKFKGEMFDLGSKIIFFKDLNIIEGGSEEKNRKAVEDKSTDVLLSPERNIQNDKLSSRNSGLNQVLCQLAHNNKIAIGFSFAELLNSKERSKVIGRWAQNIRLCRKYKVKMVLASFANNKWEMRSPKDLFSLALTLGMNGKEANEALNFKKKQPDIYKIA